MKFLIRKIKNIHRTIEKLRPYKIVIQQIVMKTIK